MIETDSIGDAPESRPLKTYLFPPSGRVVGIVALKNYLVLDCDLEPVDWREGDQRTAGYAALNPN